jgi:predicted nucleic acid-binding protein
MILVDSSIWIDHLSGNNLQLTDQLNGSTALMHPFILGEISCGNIKNRATVLQLLGNLALCPSATDDEVMYLIDQKRLMGLGIGFIDAHLLASCLIDHGTLLWTRDKRLAAVAQQLGVNYK